MEPQKLPKDTLLGNTYRIPSVKTSKDELGLSNVNAQLKNIDQHSTIRTEKTKEFTLLLQNPKLTEKQIADITKLLLKHQAIFAKSPDQLGRTYLIKHVIETGDRAAIRKRPYRVSPKQRKQIDEEMDMMLKTNIIRKSVSPWAAPVILVPKPNGEVRLCIDFREVNSVTKKDSYPLPRIDDVLDSLNGAQYFTTLDLMSGFWQIEMEETSKEKTAFITHRGLFECSVMLFGLCNAPSTFQRLMEHVLQEELWKFCSLFYYIDDIIIFSPGFEEHLQHIDKKFQRLANLKLKGSKCNFSQESATFLGHIVTRDVIKPNQENLSAVQSYPIPRSVKETRSFLGLVCYYHRFIKTLVKLPYLFITSPG